MNTVLDVFGSYGFLVRNGLITMVLAYSVYVLLSAGIFAVPQIGFMAVGAYVTSITDLRLGWSMWLSLAGGTVAGVVVGGLLAGLLHKLNGIYLALATIAFSEIVRVAAQNMKITGGLQGLYGIDPALSDLYIVGGLAFCFLGVWWISRSRHGLAIAGMRSDPLMTAHQGVALGRYRIALFMVSGGLAAYAGGLSVHLGGFVDPGAYTFAALTTVLAAAVVGGTTTGIGPVLGVVVMLGAPQVLSWLNNYRDLVSGVVIVLVVALAPSGLGGVITRLVRRTTRRRRVVADSEAGTISIDQAEAAAMLSTDNPNLKVVDIERHFGGVKAVQAVSFDVQAGEVFGLIGPNGSGKSTMLNLLSGVYKPGAGDVLLDGASLKPHFGNQAWLSRRGVARTFQNIKLINDLTVAENILFGGYARLRGGVGAAQTVRRDMRRLASEFGLTEVLEQEPSALPYGLQRRVEICRALLSRPRVLMLDEPTAGMTPAERADVFGAIRTVADRGILVIVVEHDVASMLENCDRIATLNFGRLIALGKPKEVIESEAVIEAYVGNAARG